MGNAAEVLPELVARGVVPDVVTDQTSAHDPLLRLHPGRHDAGGGRRAARPAIPRPTCSRSMRRMAQHVQAMLDLQAQGAIVFDYGNNLRQRAFDDGVKDAFGYPGFVPAYIRPLFCEGKGPFRWVALSGDPADIYDTDACILELFPEDEHLARWIRLAQERDRVPGAAGPHLLAGLRRAGPGRAGLQRGGGRAGRSRRPSSSAATTWTAARWPAPTARPRACCDGSDAIADWPILNALINAVGGATWVSFHHGGGVGIGYSLHAGQVIVADGTPKRPPAGWSGC